MTVDALRQYCLSFPSATEKLQWGDQLCFKVGGKIFVMLSLDSVPQKMCFKCTPEKFSELCEVEGIGPAPYVGRYKWVMLDGPDILPAEELKDLIRQSYEMVSAGKKIKKAKARKRRKPEVW